MVIIHGWIKINPEHRSEFLEEADRAVKQSQAEEGNLGYRLFEAVDETNTFMTLEKWADQAAIDKHKRSEHFNNFLESTKGWMLEPLQIDTHVVPNNDE